MRGRCGKCGAFNRSAKEAPAKKPPQCRYCAHEITAERDGFCWKCIGAVARRSTKVVEVDGAAAIRKLIERERMLGRLTREKAEFADELLLGLGIQ